MGRILLWIVLALAVLLGLAFAFLGDPEVPRETLMQKYGGTPSQFLTLPSGATAHYRDQGNASGPALVLLHGSNASLHTWEPWVANLADEFRVVTVDLPGHGLTVAKANDELTSESMARFVDEFTTALGITNYALGGNSMGGAVAARAALLFPAKVSKLILVDSGGVIPPDMKPPPVVFMLAAIPVVRELLRLFPTRPIYEGVLKACFTNDALVTPQMIDQYWELNRGPGIREANRKRFTMGMDYFKAEDAYFRGNLGKLAMPALIL
jgi:pimeloyl-ACP methyl ester carboxylesterase